MDNQFETAVGTVGWQADDEGLQVAARRRTERIRWQEVTGAALVRVSSPDPDPAMPTDLLPGMGKLFNLNRSLAAEQGQLILARGRSALRAFRVPIPVDDPGAMALVDEVRCAVGDRWAGKVPSEEQEEALGIRNPWWFYPILIVGLIAFGYTVLCAIAAFAALTSGQAAEVPLVAWLALLVWLLLVGWIFFLYRRRL
jgi:hypothetical protein